MVTGLAEAVAEWVSIVGVLFGGYFIGRLVEAWLIGSWNNPNERGKRLLGSEKSDKLDESDKSEELDLTRGSKSD